MLHGGGVTRAAHPLVLRTEYVKWIYTGANGIIEKQSKAVPAFNHLHFILHITAISRAMPFIVPSCTVDRLDKPSSYAAGKVFYFDFRLDNNNNFKGQSKKRRRRDDDENEREKSPDLEEKLKDATTLYVGNLYDS